MMPMGFDSTAGIYTVWSDSVSFEFDRVRWDRYGGLGAEVTVTITQPVERQVLSAWATLTTTDGRAKLAKHLTTRAGELADEWPDLVETACVKVRDHHRLGEPAVTMLDVPDVEVTPQLRDAKTGDMVIPANELTGIFGDSDTGKSMVALLFAAIMHTGRSDLAGLEVPDGRPVRVAYADWETSAATTKARLRRMFGDFFPKDMLYVPGGGVPLRSSVDRFRRIIRQHRINFLIIDSIAYAAGGSVNDDEIATEFRNALGQLGLGSTLGALAVGHVNRADAERRSARSPIGSTFWRASSRWGWFLRRTESVGDRYRIGMYNEKHNLGPKARAIGLTLDYTNGGLVFSRSEVTDDPELAAGESLSVRVHKLLAANRGEPMTYKAIADALNESEDVVGVTIRRGLGTVFVKVPHGGREAWIGLLNQEKAA